MEETQQEEDETRVEESAGDASPSKIARIAGVKHRATYKQPDDEETQSMERRQCQSCSFPATSKTEADCSVRSADTSGGSHIAAFVACNQQGSAMADTAVAQLARRHGWRRRMAKHHP